MNYLIIGAGGTGGPLGAYLANAGKNVTLLARGAHLAAMRESRLHIVRPAGDIHLFPVKAESMETYHDTPDVIFVCVKGYSLPEVIPFIQRTARKDTIIIPLLNLYGTGGRMQEELPELLVTDGCIYVAASIDHPGCVRMTSNLLRVVFGVREPEAYRPELDQIALDLRTGGVECVLSDNIRRDALMKFAYVSPQGACGLYYHIPAGGMQSAGEARECYIALMEEIALLGKVMGVPLAEDYRERNLAVLDSLPPDMTTSLQKDVAAGKQSEIDGLIFQVVRMGKQLGVHLPAYEKIAAKLSEKTVPFD